MAEETQIICQQCQSDLVPNLGEFLDALAVSCEASDKASKIQFSGELCEHSGFPPIRGR